MIPLLSFLANALLGATRATILRSVLDGNTTTGLASLTGVAPATISHHTGVLRNAGLIATNRDGNCARHCITPLGLRVLTAHD
jgi:DNA-binding transcriptional ArsR family regulator